MPDFLTDFFSTRYSAPKCIHKFAIGTRNVDLGQIEDAAKSDILALPQLADSYSALTQKVGLSFSWISRNMNSKFVFKGDEGRAWKIVFL